MLGLSRASRPRTGKQRETETGFETPITEDAVLGTRDCQPNKDPLAIIGAANRAIREAAVIASIQHRTLDEQLDNFGWSELRARTL